MKRRQWTSQEKLKIVLEGLSGQIEISKLCSKYQIAQTQYYQWRDQLLKFGNQAFEQKNVTKKEQRLEQQNAKLKRIMSANPGEQETHLPADERAQLPGHQKLPPQGQTHQTQA